MPFHVAVELISRAEKIVSGIGDSLAPVDLEQFWKDQAVCAADPFGAACPQLPLGIGMSNECVFAELDEPEDWFRLLHDDEYRVALEKRYNDQAERIVGRRLLSESAVPADRKWPEVKALNDIFEAKNEWSSWSYWIKEAASTPDELEALLDRVERRLENLRAFILPERWEEEKARLTGLGENVPLYRGQRGPVTFATSVYGPENLIFLIMDKPELAERYRDLILEAILARAAVLDKEAGYTTAESPKGWGWADDNCVLLNPEMYEFFGAPIVKGVFDVYAPDADDRRGQHSDSGMGHLLPILARFNLHWVNFGPSLSVTEIREHMPNTVIQGQLAPFTFSRDEHVHIVAETLRDYEMSRAAKGVVFSTAGSINSGSRLSGLRLIMHVIQNHCRY